MDKSEIIISVVLAIALVFMFVYMRSEFGRVKVKIKRVLDERDDYSAALQLVADGDDPKLAGVAATVLAKYKPVTTHENRVS
ncbi:hypothetical protein RYA05_03940 [Pseudomonas syringae pv. actinidiae]|nr:hypothetical protein [Pseudomonas syringae pv. actinidiae]